MEAVVTLAFPSHCCIKLNKKLLEAYPAVLTYILFLLRAIFKTKAALFQLGSVVGNLSAK